MESQMSLHNPMTAAPIGPSPLTALFWERSESCSTGSVLIADLPRSWGRFNRQFLLVNLEGLWSQLANMSQDLDFS